MNHNRPSEAVPGRALPRFQLRVWHFWLLALFVAVAIVNIQDQRRSEPVLIGLAAAGFVIYGLLGWGMWLVVRSLQPRLGRVAVLALYLTGMAALFLVATSIYLILEHGYVNGAFRHFRLF